MYTPVVKARQAEFAALQPWVGKGAQPLYELVPDSRGRGLGAELIYSLEHVQTHWAAPCLVDVSLLADASADRQCAWELATFWLQRNSINWAAPSVSTNDDAAVLVAASGLAVLAGRAAVRVDAEHTDPTSLYNDLHATANALHLSASQVDVLLDWKDAPNVRRLDDLERSTRAALTACGAGWNRVTVTGTGAGPNPSKNGPARRTRREWTLWLRLHHNGIGLPQRISFGDYGGFPAPKLGFARGSIPTVRYTDADGVTIYRERDGAGRGGGHGFHHCARQIAASGVFSGASFSEGDATIAAAALDRTAGGGGSTGWRTVALQHHFALVMSQLASPPAAPPASTP